MNGAPAGTAPTPGHGAGDRSERGRIAKTITGLIDAAPSVVLIEGELGVGKSHLLRGLRTSTTARGRLALSAACTPFASELGPVLEAALSHPRLPPRPNPVLGALVPRLPELADRLPPALPPLPDPRADLARCFRALRELFSYPAPLVLMLDDVQWCDAASRAFLRYLCAHRLPALAIVLAYRPHADLPLLTHLAEPAFPVEHVRLGPLRDREAVALAESLHGQGPLPPGLRRALSLAEGLPHAITALVRDFGRAEGDDPGGRAKSVAVAIPGALRDVHTEWFRLCGKEARALLHAAAVCEQAVTEDELRVLSGLTSTAIGDAMAEAVATGVLREAWPNHFVWSREVARRVVHESTSPATRRRLHHTAAALRPHDAVFTAHHLYQAGDLDRWRDHSEHNADAAIGSGDWTTAVHLLRALLRNADLTDSDRVRFATVLSRAAFDGLDCEQIVVTVREILSEVPLPSATRGELRNNLGILLLSQFGDHEGGYRELETAVGELRDSDPPLALKVMSSLALPYSGQRHVDTHLGWLGQVEAGLDAAPLLDPLTEATVQVNRLTALMTVGAPEAWAAAEVVSRDTDDPELARQRMRGCLNLADGSSWLGHYAAAQGFLVRGRAWSTQLGADYLAEQLRVTAVRLNWLRGDWSTLRASAEQLVGRYHSLPRVASECRLIAGALAFEHGDSQAAVTLLSGVGAARSRETAAPPVRATTGALLARHHYHRGARTTAARELDGALRIIQQTGLWVWASEVMPIAVEVLHGLDRGTEVAALLRTMEHGLDGRDAPAATAGLTLSRAMDLDLGGGAAPTVVAAYDDALASFADLGRPYWTATTHVWRDRFVHTELHQETDDLDQAIELFGALGATAAESSARASLHSRRPKRRGRPSYGPALSPREVEVAHLASAGRTNAQIAARLGLSVRTVEQHIAKAMRKTGAASRHELTS
ncbi:LuxR family transcriptional regulator [Longispora sp. NPDC051575]|uniref:LuxR family transcriptional regulator n=1 Tax=Longispora sp. NPDC051575 TaxID=3154943 RepID=UPI003432C6D2